MATNDRTIARMNRTHICVSISVYARASRTDAKALEIHGPPTENVKKYEARAHLSLGRPRRNHGGSARQIGSRPHARDGRRPRPAAARRKPHRRERLHGREG